MLLRYGALAVGVLIVSTAALLLRLAIDVGADPLAVAAGRLTVAAALIVPFALLRRAPELASLEGRDWMVAAVAGLFLAVHFATWIASLKYTSVASSVALVTTNPIWVGLAAWLILGEPPSRRAVAGIVLAIAGSLLILAADVGAVPQPGRAPAFGNALALAGAMSISGYFLVGRRLNMKLSLLAYVAIVYGAAAVAMNVIAEVAGEGIAGLPPQAWLPVLLVALGPQLAGHTIINWSLRHLSATFVALAILGEPVGSAVLAWLFLGEGFGPLQLAGFATLLAGIAIAATGERPAADRAPA
jgi:drug/metabolite transporter (DMT)-like permease